VSCFGPEWPLLFSTPRAQSAHSRISMIEKKRMKIKILPNVLALHLKRFKLLPAEDKYVKLAYRVAFPLELRLFNTVDDAEDPDRLYQLFATVVHIGGYVSHAI